MQVKFNGVQGPLWVIESYDYGWGKHSNERYWCTTDVVFLRREDARKWVKDHEEEGEKYRVVKFEKV